MRARACRESPRTKTLLFSIPNNVGSAGRDARTGGGFYTFRGDETGGASRARPDRGRAPAARPTAQPTGTAPARARGERRAVAWSAAPARSERRGLCALRPARAAARRVPRCSVESSRVVARTTPSMATSCDRRHKPSSARSSPSRWLVEIASFCSCASTAAYALTAPAALGRSRART